VAEHALDDALQEVFIVVHRRLGDFEGRASLRTWIYAITYRVAQSHRRRSRQQEVEELSSDLPALGPTPLEAAERAQAGELVLSFLEGMPDSKRDVFVLCVLEDLSAPEASSILDVNVNTVYSRLRHVRAEFKQMLDEHEAQFRRSHGG
jgi:RNA polymerase sigma-70 factor (ECF subfamily)